MERRVHKEEEHERRVYRRGTWNARHKGEKQGTELIYRRDT
jgi:hypothetical protein